MWTIVALILTAAQNAATSVPVQTPEQAVLEADRSFWQSFNRCDVEGMASYVTDDLEFYHDKAGLSSGKVVFVQNTQDGMCKPGGTRIRREPIAASVRFYPIAGYGGILMGEHIFYVKEPGKAEYLDGQARFAHVWHFGDGKWQMRRVLSYDHGPPQADAIPARIKLSAEALANYAGRYQSGQGLAVVTPEENGLRIVAGELTLSLQPVSETSFLFPERNLRFDFEDDGFSVWENGAKVDEARRLD
jgi:hypothetical protein